MLHISRMLAMIHPGLVIILIVYRRMISVSGENTARDREPADAGQY